MTNLREWSRGTGKYQRLVHDMVQKLKEGSSVLFACRDEAEGERLYEDIKTKFPEEYNLFFEHKYSKEKNKFVGTEFVTGRTILNLAFKDINIQ